ncbi:dickkopf-related protein 2 [Callorhinchus milii]|uniref:dickkopf-related protein 2 n=1 Tax=Callorhinchus milii TaxID=7868 RepID=UPI000457242C|nr:dickkopf-related protein 2 [Callorhinchus milii]|eukprot:gi/632978375/ref/XP_007905878.1/ PREDICTED: dickkopf-related protein 2 [Callorhinchus milii]
MYSWLLLAALLMLSAHGVDSGKSKVNAIKSGASGQQLAEQLPTHNRSAGIVQRATVNKKNPLPSPGQIQPCSSDKECGTRGYCQHSHHQSFPTCLSCRRRKKRCHRDAMCCPGNYCSNGICIQLLEGTNHRATTGDIQEHSKKRTHHGTKGTYWQNVGNTQTKPSREKGHEGDSCLRSSDCAEGFCCARHFWTKICKPVLRQGEVCTKQRRKGSHGLELFQRCDCAKGLSCKIWKEAKSRLHICQKV